jgi:hypothetical protein
MVINSTNINKTNNHLSSYLTEHKGESLESNGHQFHQYQQCKQSPLVLFSGLRWEVIVCFVDIGGIDDHYCLSFLVCVQWVKVRGDCLICWYWWNWWPLLFKLSQRWPSIPPISTKQTITSHLNSLNTKKKS